MWSDFVFIALVQLAILITPGYFVLRAIGKDRLSSLCLGPALSVGLLGAACVCVSKTKIACTWLTAAVPVTIVAVITCTVAIILRRRRGGGRFEEHPMRWALLFGYVLAGVVIGVYVFLSVIEDPNNFNQRLDNYMHLSVIRGFVDSGDMTVFGVSPYMTSADAAITPHGHGGFYPTGFYMIAALAITALSVPVAVAENALLFAFTSIVFPMGSFLLMDRLGDGDKRFSLCGCIATVSFVAFPWNLIQFGPIYPNAASLCLFPAVAVFFLDVVEQGACRKKRFAALACLLLAVVSCAIAQPNTVFFSIAMLLPLAVASLYRMGVDAESPSGSRVRKLKARNLVLCTALVIAVCVFWFALYQTSYFQQMLASGWPPTMSLGEALIRVLVIETNDAPSQVILGLVVLIGLVFMLVKRKHRWLVVSYLIIGLMVVLGLSSDSLVRNILDAFCYTDPRRLWAFLALCAMPIAAYGLSAIIALVEKAFASVLTRWAHALAPALVLVAFVLLNMSFGFQIATGNPAESAFEVTRKSIVSGFRGEEEITLTNEERQFIRRAMEVVPGDSLVINLPSDGSMFAYGSEGIRTYYRYPSLFQKSGEVKTSKRIRKELNEVAGDDKIKKGLKKLGAEYVLLLDAGEDGDSIWRMYGENEGLWGGIASIDDATPGFETVLSDGDMRLYKIKAG